MHHFHWLFRYLISFGDTKRDGNSGMQKNNVIYVGLCGFLPFTCEISHCNSSNVGPLDTKDSVIFQKTWIFLLCTYYYYYYYYAYTCFFHFSFNILIYLLTYLIIYSLTSLPTPWSEVLLEKLTGSQLVKKFPAFYGTRTFITAFTSARHLSLPWASSIQSIPPHPTCCGSIPKLFPSKFVSSKWSL
jgi:hypothetical protein